MTAPKTTVFATRMFRGAAIYGVLALVPLYFQAIPSIGAESHFGFIGVALVFQWLFWIIGGNPVAYRTLMLPAVAEKLAFAMPVLGLRAGGHSSSAAVFFAGIDLALATGFILAWRKTPSL